jgi:hypothetical protein
MQQATAQVGTQRRRDCFSYPGRAEFWVPQRPFFITPSREGALGRGLIILTVVTVAVIICVRLIKGH